METATRQSRWHRIRYAGLPIAAIIRRELVSVLRLKRASVFLLVFQILLLFPLATMWPVGYANWPEIRSMSENLQLIYAECALFMLLIAIPGVAATAIVREREQDTLGLLAAAGFAPKDIVLGKLVAAVGFVSLLLISMLPILALSYFLIGVDLEKLAMRFSILLSCAFSAGAIGLMVSTYSRKTIHALFGSFLLVAALHIGPVFALAMVQEFNLEGVITELGMFLFGVPLAPEEVLVLFLPALAIAADTVGVPRFIPMGFGWFSMEWWVVAMQLMIGLFVLLIAWRRVRRLWGSLWEAAPSATKKPHERTRLRNKRRAREFGDHWNPVYLRERRFELLFQGRSRWIPRMMVFGIVAGGIIHFANPLIGGIPYMGWTWVEQARFSLSEWVLYISLGVAFLTPLLFANLLNKETVGRQNDALRMTLMRPHEIIFGKAGAGSVTLARLVAVALIPIPIIAIYPIQPHVSDVVEMSATLVLVLILLPALSIYAGTRVRHTVGALMLAYTLVFWILIGNFLLYYYFADLLVRYTSIDLYQSTFIDDMLSPAGLPYAIRNGGAATWLMVVWYGVVGISALAGAYYFTVRRWREDG